MVFSKSTLIAIFITHLVVTTGLAANSFNGCTYVDPSGRCGTCFKRKVLSSGKGCGPLQPETDECLIYTYNFVKKTSICSYCKTGFASQVIVKLPYVYQSCVKATFTNCLLEDDLVSKGQETKTCVACPIKGEFAVADLATGLSTCEKIDNPDPNCKWGSNFESWAEKPRCIRCEEGYAVNGVIRNCIPVKQEGCWIVEMGTCVACDPFGGWSTNSDYTCFKTTD